MREVGSKAVQRDGDNEMMCSNRASGSGSFTRFSGWPVTVGSVAFIVGAVVLAGLRYHAHLLWKYQERRLGLQSVSTIPDYPMPITVVPEGWVRSRVGCIEFSLPRELAASETARANGGSIFSCQEGSRVVAVSAPTDDYEVSALLKAATHLCPRSQRYTMPSLRLACYRASSGDFCWSMTPEEVRWHAFRITTSKLIRPISDGSTESLSVLRDDLDGIVHFFPGGAMFEWYCKVHMRGGYMLFTDCCETGNRDWIRAVSQSIRIAIVQEADACHSLNK